MARFPSIDNTGAFEAPEVQDHVRSLAQEEAPPKLPVNLVDMTESISGWTSGSGAVYPHSVNRYIEIEVKPDTYYSSYHTVDSRVNWYDSSGSNIPGMDNDQITSQEVRTWLSPSNAVTAIFALSSVSGVDYLDWNAIFNEGEILLDIDNPHNYPPSGYWDDRELPPVSGGGSIDEDTLTVLVERLLPQYEPSTPTLQFETVTTGWSSPRWLSEDGEVLYGGQGHILQQSTDEWETTTTIHEFATEQTIQAIRELDNGELIVSTSRDESIDLRAKVWLSSGYDRGNPTAATWTEVLESLVTQANFVNSWGLNVYQNIVLASEYGLRGEQGARHVYLSEDYGQTFRVIFDQMTTTANIPGAPEWTETAHLHTVAWDPYWARIWLVVGDNPNTATYYSDDKGDTWIYVEGSGGPAPAVQYTGIQALPDVVLFGSDRSPNGLHAYRRGEKSDMPVIKPLLVLDEETSITKVFQLPFKRDWNPTTPTYFTATGAAGDNTSVIVSTVDGKKAHLLWEGVSSGEGGALSGNLRYAFGPTAQGNIIGAMYADPTVTGTRIMKAPAPTWERV